MTHPTDDPLREALDLLPCPFCGGHAEFSVGKYGDGRDWHYIECSQCEATAPKVSYADHGIRLKEALAEAWNARATLAAAPQPSARDALQAIADLPTGRTEEVMEGQEQAYRAVERLFPTPPMILARPSAPETQSDDLRPALERVRQITLQAEAARFCMAEIIKRVDMALGEDTALPGWMLTDAPETLAWAVVVDGEIVWVDVGAKHDVAEHVAEGEGGKPVRVTIRVVEGGDDAT